MNGVTSNIPLRIMVMAGGTGGHVFPALAVADELRDRGVEVTWLGTRRGLEAEVVAGAGFPIDYIQVSGLRGKSLWSWLLAPVKLLLALVQGWLVIRRRDPMAVLGMGGFVSGPGGVAAWLTRCPLLIHEQNAIAGLTNRLLGPLAARIMEAFPDTFEQKPGLKDKVLLTGNPLRKQFLQAGRETHAADSIHLLVIGGSLGAAYFNDIVPEALALMDQSVRPNVWHQAGKRNIEAAREAYIKHGIEARVEPFIDDMASAYAWADLVICRAGAMTISELAVAGVASILVPYPFAVDDHQTANAHYLSDQHAAVLLPQAQMTAHNLTEIISGLSSQQLQAMAEAAGKLARPEATKHVADQCVQLARGVAHG